MYRPFENTTEVSEEEQGGSYSSEEHGEHLGSYEYTASATGYSFYDDTSYEVPHSQEEVGWTSDSLKRYPSAAHSPLMRFQDSGVGEQSSVDQPFTEKIQRFKKKNILQWNSEDSMDWAINTCYSLNIDPTVVNIQSFNKPGNEISQMTDNDFADAVGYTYAGLFEKNICTMKRQQKQKQKYHEDPYSFQRGDPIGSQLSAQFSSSVSMSHEFSNVPYDDADVSYGSDVPSRGPSMSPDSEPDSTDLFERVNTTRNRDRGPIVWEFLARTLASDLNPSVVEWVDEAEGIFRLVQKDEIARIWAVRRGSQNYSYDNFSRCLRYQYTTGHVVKVANKKLVYKLGQEGMILYRSLMGYST